MVSAARVALVVAAVFAAAGPWRPARAQQADRAALPAPDPFLEITTIPLWEGGAPGAWITMVEHFNLAWKAPTVEILNYVRRLITTPFSR